MMPVHIVESAQQDIAQIRDYIAAEDVEASSRFLANIDRVLGLLEYQPRMGRARADLRSGIRLIPLGSYVMAYTIGRVRIDVVRVLHGARDLRSVLNEKRT